MRLTQSGRLELERDFVTCLLVMALGRGYSDHWAFTISDDSSQVGRFTVKTSNIIKGKAPGTLQVARNDWYFLL